MKVLLFDVDGTLVRAGGAGRRALDKAVENLYGHAGACAELDLAGKTDLRNFTEAIGAAKRARGDARRPHRGEVERVHEEYLRLLPRYVRAALRDKRYHVCAGVRPLLRRLSREKGVLLGLGTGNMERGAHIKLAPSGLGAYFLFGGYGSDAFHRPALLKAGARRARALLDGLGGRRSIEEVYVIGDTPLDVEAGRKAGFKTIAVGTGFAEWKDLVRSKPDHIARDFRRIGTWLKWLGIRPKAR